MESVEIIMNIWFWRMLRYQHKLCASLFLCTYFLFGIYILFISASDPLLWFDFLSCNSAVLMRAPCAWGSHAHKFRWGLFFLLPRGSKIKSQVWPGVGVWQLWILNFHSKKSSNCILWTRPLTNNVKSRQIIKVGI